MKKLIALIKQKSGFTLIELIIFSAIFSLVSIVFVAMLVSITSVQLKQTASSEVNRQSQFVLQTIQGYIERSSLVETTSTPSQSLLLRMPSAIDGSRSFGTSSLIHIYWETSTAASTIYLKAGSNNPEAITSPNIRVDELTFKKYSRPGSHDSISFSMALSYNGSTSTAKKFFQRLATTATRVSAATFDSPILPAAQLKYDDLTLGTTGSRWKSINDMLFFDTGADSDDFDAYFLGVGGVGNFGIGTNIPTSKFHVVGNSLFAGDVTINNGLNLNEGVKLGTGGSPECDSLDDVGYMYLVLGFGGSPTDEIQICLRIDGGYSWRAVTTTIPINAPIL